MKSITLASYGKINLSLNVGNVMDNGYHPVDMIMCQTLLHDLVKIDVPERENTLAWEEQSKRKYDGSEDMECPEIEIIANLPYIPIDENNICHRAATEFFREVRRMSKLTNDRKHLPSKVTITLEKRVPVGAGLGGGSGNAAAVLHGLNAVLGIRFSMEKLLEIGSTLGADVPFAVMNQAKSCKSVPSYLRQHPMASVCARAGGIGTELTPLKIPPFKLILVKPPFSVSTAEVYKGIDSCEIPKRPDNDSLTGTLRALAECGEERLWKAAYANMINVLENYTIPAHPVLGKIKDRLKESASVDFAMMSGSGPTIFAILSEETKGREIYDLKRKFSVKGNMVYVTEVLDGRDLGIARRMKR